MQDEIIDLVDTTTAGECFPYQNDSHAELKNYIEDLNRTISYLDFCEYFNIPISDQI